MAGLITIDAIALVRRPSKSCRLQTKVDQLVFQELHRQAIAGILRISDNAIDQSNLLAMLHLKPGQEEDRLGRGQDVANWALGRNESEAAEIRHVVR